jgi:hypothetical protein
VLNMSADTMDLVAVCARACRDNERGSHEGSGRRTELERPFDA